MEFMVNIDLEKHPEPIGYRDKIMLVGSCFTEHIGNSLQNLKFKVFQNPNGILFGPDAVCRSLISYVHNREFKEKDIFQLNETWNSWQHHSRFSGINVAEVLTGINASQQKAHHFLKDADWLIITLGSSSIYRLSKEADLASEELNSGVANCHRAPASWFRKEMIETPGIISLLEDCMGKLQQFNPRLKFIFTISPVRHIRDGVIENNRSKARLIEAVHAIIEKNNTTFYFPAYELVIDVLRDYRFYDIDLVHPNYAATNFVLEKFTECCIDDPAKDLMQEIKKIVIASKHRPFQPDTRAHRQFLSAHLEKALSIKKEYPFLDMEKELKYFSANE